MPHGRQYLLQASDEFEMNEWINLINYAGAFKTANLTMLSNSPVDANMSSPPSRRESVYGDTTGNPRPESSNLSATLSPTLSEVGSFVGDKRSASFDRGEPTDSHIVTSFEAPQPLSSLHFPPMTTMEVEDAASRIEMLKVSLVLVSRLLAFYSNAYE